MHNKNSSGLNEVLALKGYYFLCSIYIVISGNNDIRYAGMPLDRSVKYKNLLLHNNAGRTSQNHLEINFILTW